jgi:hypothetical protein
MRTLVLFIVLGLSTPALAFEGEIQLKAAGSANSGLAAMTILVSKDGDVRMEMTAKGDDGAPHKMGYLKPAKGKYNYTLDHQSKRAMKIPKDAFDKVAKNSKVDKKMEKANVEIQKLGKEKIAGDMTRHIRVIDKDTGAISDIWLSDKYSAQLWSQAFGFGGKAPTDQMENWNKAAKELGFKPGFIMKMVHKDEDGSEGGLEVVKIAEKKIGGKSFLPPAGYDIQEMNMPAGELGDMPIKAPTTREEAERMRDEWMKKMKEMER